MQEENFTIGELNSICLLRFGVDMYTEKFSMVPHKYHGIFRGEDVQMTSDGKILVRCN